MGLIFLKVFGFLNSLEQIERDSKRKDNEFSVSFS